MWLLSPFFVGHWHLVRIAREESVCDHSTLYTSTSLLWFLFIPILQSLVFLMAYISISFVRVTFHLPHSSSISSSSFSLSLSSSPYSPSECWRHLLRFSIILLCRGRGYHFSPTRLPETHVIVVPEWIQISIQHLRRPRESFFRHQIRNSCRFKGTPISCIQMVLQTPLRSPERTCSSSFPFLR